MDLNIPQGEHGQIRVFAISRASADMRRALNDQGKAALANGLLNHQVPEHGVEIFPVVDLSGVGLTGYLSQGYAVPEEQLRGDRDKLEALDGYVLLLFSAAFEGREISLSPNRDLTLIGTYGEAQPDMTARQLHSAASEAYSGTTAGEKHPPFIRRRAGALTVAILIALMFALLRWSFG